MSITIHQTKSYLYLPDSNKLKQNQRELTNGGFSLILCWGTRTRTRKDRTRICSVANYTIPQTLKFDSLPKQIELLGYPDSNQERQDQNL